MPMESRQHGPWHLSGERKALEEEVMRIRFLGIMPATGYSGGRLMSLTMAEALAMNGARVDFLTNCFPEMHQEFRPSRIDIHRAFEGLNFSLSAWNDDIDVMVIVPHLGRLGHFSSWLCHAIECKSKIVLLNFETPNWFNSVSPFKRDESQWEGWRIVSEYASLVLSISGEGNRFAKEYYWNAAKNCTFDYAYPGINSVAADKAPEAVRRDKEIIMLSRIDAHKGFNTFNPLLMPELNGHAVTLYLGNVENLDQKRMQSWRRKFEHFGIDFTVRPPIKGVDKFALLKRGSLLFFPTRFEGFGIPPLEAAYCRLPCVTSNLPVLREYGGESFHYAEPGSDSSLRGAVLRALESCGIKDAEHRRLSEIASMAQYGQRLLRILEKL